MRYEHYHRYALASIWCADERVLDAACGEGYGSALLAESARSVHGVDLSTAAIEHARRRYGEEASLQFSVADVTDLPFAENSFDRVVSFETLEHLTAHEDLVSEFRRVLRPEGMLLLSSPDKAIYTEKLGNQNEFHLRELYLEELQDLLGGSFPAVRILRQKLMFHSVIWSGNAPTEVQFQHIDTQAGLTEAGMAHDAVYFIALCAEQESYLPELGDQVWMFDDLEESVYAHYYHEIRKNMAAGALLAEREAEIEGLKLALEAQRRPFWRRWIRRG